MQYKTIGKTFPLVEVALHIGESILLESGALVYHNSEINLEGKMNSNGRSGFGGVISAIGRSVSSGENFFITKASGLTNTAKIALAPATLGTIKELKVDSEHWRLNTGTFLACDASVSYNMKRQKLSGAIFGGTGGLFVMETTGSGSLLINSYGDITEIHLDGTTPFVVDNHHVVAWSESLDYNIKIASGKFGFTTGKGLVNEFTGIGTIIIQTRSIKKEANSEGIVESIL
ncbi:hypothetical protein IGL16_002671 [Enterococcus sp. AZ117]|uniref:TIGR00266 family protein n=1 Tax=unclassified Enterococcus TaxID=2608891 RepID=UPI003F27EF6E